MDNLFTVEALATLAGASYLVHLMVAYTKTYVPMPTDLYAVLVGFVVLLLAQFGLGADPTSWVVYFLALANGFLVASSAGKANDKAIDENEKKYQTDAEKG